MRLRPLTEAECYARCYGGPRDDSVKVIRPESDEAAAASRQARHADPGEEREAA